MHRIVLIGGGGHCISCIDAIEETGKYRIEGILDLPENLGKEILGYRVIGSDIDIEKYHSNGYCFCLSIGQVASGVTIRKEIYMRLKSLNVELPVIISPGANISKHSEIGEGTVIFAGARINAGAVIGENCIINSNALIEHGAHVGNHTHISTGVILNGDCEVSDDCFIGSGAIIRNGLIITSGCTIGMGSIVTRSTTDSGIYFGSPARKVK